MDISLRSILTAGISTVTATTLVFAPSVQPPPPPERTVQLTAAVQPLAPQEPLLSVLLTSPLRLLGPAVTPGTLPPAPAPLAIPIAPNLANTIDNTYLAVEPWVRYGFQVAAERARVDSVCRLVCRSDHGVLQLRRIHSRKVASSTSRIGSAGKAASSRTWSTSVSTSVWHSSGWESTSGTTSCRRCRRSVADTADDRRCKVRSRALEQVDTLMGPTPQSPLATSS